MHEKNENIQMILKIEFKFLKKTARKAQLNGTLSDIWAF